jgi:ABC-type Fe3+ transport system permease subunit
MIQTIKSYITKAIITALLLTPVLVPATASAANIENNLCKGANLTVSAETDCDEEGATSKVNGLITFIINIFSIVVGVVAVIMIIVGGLKYITSSGDSNNITSAKNTILYAIIGLVVVALAQFIVKFVLAKAINAGE